MKTNQKIRKAVIPAAAPVQRLLRRNVGGRVYGTRRVFSEMEAL